MMGKKERVFIYLLASGVLLLILFTGGINIWKNPKVRSFFSREEKTLDFSIIKERGLKKGEVVRGRAIIDYRVHGTLFESRFFKLKKFYLYPLFSGQPSIDEKLLLVLKTQKEPPSLVDREEREINAIVIGDESILSPDFIEAILQKVDGVEEHGAYLIEEIE